MRFKEGDKVEFIDQGELKQGVVTEIKASNFDISYQVKSEFMGTLWVTERDLVAPTPVLKVPQFAGDWISRCKQKGYDLFLSIDYDDSDMPYEMYNWLTFSDENQELFARAWLDGYEVEKEPLYYVKLPYFGYVTNRMDYTLSQSKTDAVMLTESKIKRMDERYWQFAVPVKDLECEA
ncbi:DUF1642 domain-containing protein [Listeria monocytogenes]|nr:DUF1642 domain-containing protein [Listeria monocytogenes]